MKRSTSRPPSRPPRAGAVRESGGQAASVFRDFVRQLERLDARSPKPAREGSR